MQLNSDSTPPPLPDGLRGKLTAYRRTLWSTKAMEGVFGAALGLALSFLVLFALDRFIETPVWGRVVLTGLGLLGGAVWLPLHLYRWIGRHVSHKSVAEHIARRDIGVGDQILGVIALTGDRQEFERSPDLARAAIAQGDRELVARDLSSTLPASRHRALGGALVAGLAASGLCFAMAPGAANNALQRWLHPTSQIERYTFTRLAPHADHLVIARFEPFQWEVDLAKDTQRVPTLASLSLSSGETLTASPVAGGYGFELPALNQEVTCQLVVGDFREEIRIEPVDRPEVAKARARVTLPDYLELPEPLFKDIRGGSLGVVEGSTVAVTAEMTRELREAAWTAGGADVTGAELQTESLLVAASADTEMRWTDIHGLTGTVPFQLGLRTRFDAKPTVVSDGLMPETILLHGQAAAFTVRATDDFGVRQVGLEWQGVGEIEYGSTVAQGEKVLGLGDPDAADLELQATLHPRLQGIDPQFLQVRAFALDAFPGRERVYSAPIRVQVMTEDEHLNWVTRSLASWFDEAVEVRDQENTLLKTNESLFQLSNAQLASPEVQRQLQAQAAGERANGRRLSGLVSRGSGLLAEAARNEQIDSNTMDDWAEMMASLEGIAGDRMPSIAELLSNAAKAESSTAPSAPTAGVARDTSKGDPNAATAKVELPSAPQAGDMESSFNDAPKTAASAGGESKAPPANLTLVGTTVQGGGGKTDPQPPASESDDAEEPGPTKAELAKAIAEQRALMEEFEKVAGKITEILQNLESSTFVKRLKALSRAETTVAQELDTTVASAFGVDAAPKGTAQVLANVSSLQETSARRASLVREDLGAYVDRMASQGKETTKYETVQKEMGEVGVTREMSTLTELAEASRSGEAIAGAENLADEFDRWAEIIVGPAKGGT